MRKKVLTREGESHAFFRSAWFWLALAFLVPLFLLGFGRFREAKAEEELSQELALARSEGIVTDIRGWEELHPPVPDEENAALIYREIAKTRWDSIRGYGLASRITNGEVVPTTEIREALSAGEKVLCLVDRAVQMHRARFSVDWDDYTDGMATSSDVVRAAERLILLRAELAKRSGKEGEALSEAKKLKVVASHMRSTGDPEGFEQEAILNKALAEMLCLWAIREPQGSIWEKELADLIEGTEIPSQEEIFRSSLFHGFRLMTDLQSKEGRKQRGYEEAGTGWFYQGNLGPMISVTQGKVMMVRGFRTLLSEMKKGGKGSKAVIENAAGLYVNGMKSIPDLHHGWAGEASDILPMEHGHYLRDMKTLLVAALRMLRSKERDETVSLAGLTSSKDGLPVRADRRTRWIGLTCGDIGMNLLAPSGVNPSSMGFSPGVAATMAEEEK